MKKVVSILLALAMALTCLCGSAFAAKEGKVTIWDGVFPLQKGKIYIINQNTVLSRDVVIPVSSTLIIKNNATLKIPAEHSVTVKGTLKINPKGRIWLFGTLNGTEKSAINVYGSINTAKGTEINICGKLNVYKSGKIVGHGEINPSTFLGITNGGKISVDINKPKPREVNGITYVGEVQLVNKEYSVPSTYAPGLNSELEAAFNKMKKAAAADGIDLKIISGFRSYDKQKSVHDYWVSLYGEKAANMISATPGNSEHQTGLAIDINDLVESFADTPAGRWLAKNAVDYGFILRYPKEKSDITGYSYEPWHFRYVGTELAKMIDDSGLTLEEFLGVA